jgi:hypothetical protein
LANFDEQIHRVIWDLLQVVRLGASFEFEEVLESFLRLAQTIVRGVKFKIPLVDCLLFQIALVVKSIRMSFSGASEELCPERFQINLRPPRLIQQRETVDHGTVNESVAGRQKPESTSPFTGLSTKTFAARATTGGVWILDLESAPLQRLDVIQLAARHVKRALGIDHHFDTAALHEDIPIGRGILQIHFVLQPGTPAAKHSHSKHACRSALLS